MSGERKKSRGRGKKRKNGNNRRKNDKNKRQKENDNTNNKRGGGDGQQEDVGNIGSKGNISERARKQGQQKQQGEKSRQARDLSSEQLKINSKHGSQPELEIEDITDRKEQTNFNNPSVIKTENGEAKREMLQLGQNTKNIKIDAKGKFGKGMQSYGDLNYTLGRAGKDGVEPLKGEGSEQLQMWRKRLRQLLGEEMPGSENMVRKPLNFPFLFKKNSLLKDEEGRRMRRESSEPIYSSEHRIAWLCGDPSRQS